MNWRYPITTPEDSNQHIKQTKISKNNVLSSTICNGIRQTGVLYCRKQTERAFAQLSEMVEVAASRIDKQDQKSKHWEERQKASAATISTAAENYAKDYQNIQYGQICCWSKDTTTKQVNGRQYWIVALHGSIETVRRQPYQMRKKGTQLSCVPM